MSETIQQTISRITSFIQANAPTVDLSPGSVFSELLVNLEGQVQNQLFSDIDDISAVQAISTALSALGDTYSPVIDAIASNYNVYRNQGTASTGTIQIFVSNFTNYNVASGVSFTQPTLGYVYTTSSSTSVLSSQLIAQNGTYYFFVPVTAQTTGQVTAISNGTQFIPNNPSQIPGFVSAQAFGAFTAGLNTETDKQLIARFRNGLGVNNLLSQNSITNQLETAYPLFQDAYVADIASPVNTRSLSNPLGIKIPGCVDVWVKDGITIPYVQVTVTDAVYNDGAWHLTIPNTAAPGFYRIVNVTTSADPTTKLPFIYLYTYNSSSPNLINTVEDARFSCQQGAVITSTGSSWPSYTGSAVSFVVTVLAVPDLFSMQALFLNDANRIPCADYLVKGIVPCMVSMSISLIRNNPGDAINLAGLQSDIFNYVNGLSVGQPVAVSQIVKLCHNYNIARVDLPIILNGTILAPTFQLNSDETAATDNNIIISGTDYLQIPDLPSLGVIPQNTMFFVSYYNSSGQSNININIQ